MADPVLLVRDLVKDFGRVRALAGVSFEVAEKEIFGLIGPNGAGKTTTLRIVATLLHPGAGSVSILGNDVVSNSGRVRTLISYLPEEAGAYRNLRGIEYLKYMAGFYAAGYAAKRTMVESAVAIARLEARIKDKISTYSKGMVRKLLIARALMHRPRLAILDEPTSGLDVMNSLEVRNIIRQYAAEATTVLVSSHNMLEVEFLSHRVAMIDKGRIVECGEPQALKAKHAARNLEEVFVRVMA